MATATRSHLHVIEHIPLRCCLCGAFMHVNTCDVPSGRFCLGRRLSSKSGVQIGIGRTSGTRKHTVRVSLILDAWTYIQNTCWVRTQSTSEAAGRWRRHAFACPCAVGGYRLHKMERQLDDDFGVLQHVPPKKAHAKNS